MRTLIFTASGKFLARFDRIMALSAKAPELSEVPVV